MDYKRYDSDVVKPAAAAATYSDAEAGVITELRNELEVLRRRTKRSAWTIAALAIFVVLFFICFVGVAVHFGHDIEHLEEGESAEGASVEGASVEGASTGSGNDLSKEGSGDLAKGDPDGDGDNIMLSSKADVSDDLSRVGTLFGGNGYWSPRSVMPEPLAGMYVAARDGYVYLAGGTRTDLNQSHALYEYDALLNIYTQGPSLPFGLSRGAMAFDTKNKKLVIVGGESNNTLTMTDPDHDGDHELEIASTTFNCTLMLDMSKYDPEAENKSTINGTQWKQGSCMNTPRTDFCAVTLNGFVYVFGGHAHGVEFDYTTAVERYDVANDKWEVMSSLQLPHGRSDVACTVGDNGLIYIAGGEYTTNEDSSPNSWILNELLEVDVNKGTVRQLASMPYQRAYTQITALPNRRLLVTGGEFTYYGKRTAVAYHEVSMYHIDSNTWEMRPRLYEERFLHSAAYALDAVHVFGGYQSCTDDNDVACAPFTMGTHIVFWDVEYPEIYVQASSKLHYNDTTDGAANVTSNNP